MSSAMIMVLWSKVKSNQPFHQCISFFAWIPTVNGLDLGQYCATKGDPNQNYFYIVMTRPLLTDPGDCSLKKLVVYGLELWTSRFRMVTKHNNHISLDSAAGGIIHCIA